MFFLSPIKLKKKKKKEAYLGWHGPQTGNAMFLKIREGWTNSHGYWVPFSFWDWTIILEDKTFLGSEAKFTWHLPWAQHNHGPPNPMRWVPLLFPFYRWENQGPERWNNFPSVTQRVKSGACLHHLTSDPLQDQALNQCVKQCLSVISSSLQAQGSAHRQWRVW